MCWGYLEGTSGSGISEERGGSTVSCEDGMVVNESDQICQALEKNSIRNQWYHQKKSAASRQQEDCVEFVDYVRQQCAIEGDSSSRR